jgi:tetratricopeptide (TPR) repeat protein
MAPWFGLLLLFAQGGSSAGALHHNARELAGEASAYQAAVKANPESADAWAGLGRTLLLLGRPGDAAVCLNKALHLAPGDTGIQTSLARSYLDAGNIGAAIALLEAGTEPSNAEVVRLLGEAMYRGGYYDRALQLLGPAGAAPPDARAAGMRAVSLAKTGRIAEAEAACMRLLDQPAAQLDLDVVLTYVEILDNSGRGAQAMFYADMAIQDQPGNPMAHLWKARLLWHLGKNAEAAKEAEQSVSLSPELPFARNLLLQIYRKQGRVEEARRQADWLREYNDGLASRGR